MATSVTESSRGASHIQEGAATGLALIVALLVGSVFGLRLLATRSHNFLYNSDQVHTLMVVRDLLADPTSLFAWYHSPALFVVPDWVLAFLLLLVGTPVPYVPIVFYAASSGLLAVAFAAFLWASGLAGFARALIVSSVVVALIFASAAILPPFSGSSIVATIAAPSLHSGSVSLGLLVAAACLRLVSPEMRVSRPAAAAIIIFCFIGGYSDLLFAVWFVAPIAIVLALRARPRTLRSMALPAAMMAAPLVAFAIDFLSRSSEGYFRAMLRQRSTLKSLESWRELISNATAQGDWMLLLTAAVTLVMLPRGLLLCWRFLRQESASRAHAAELTLIGAHFSALLVPLVLGVLQDPNNLRYSMPVFLTGFFWLALKAVERRPLSSRWATISLAAATAIVTLILLPSSMDSARAVARPGPLSACLLASGDRVGFAEYWRAKSVMLETDYRVHIVQITDRARAYRFNINGRWYERHALDGKPLGKATFIVMHDLVEEEIRGLFGTPDRIERCGGETIWRYDAGVDPALVTKPR